MKRLLLSILPFLFLGYFAQAQTLEFSQVVLYDMANSTEYSFTVPTGKVWKIESATSSYASAFIYLRNSSSQNIGVLSYSSTHPKKVLPMWLPSGFSGKFYYQDSGSDRAVVSIIEFNVVP